MIRYIALLRGVNVGGHRIIKMEDLAHLFTELTFKEVRTYIQSGNVLFNAAKQNTDTLRKKIETHLLGQLGYEVPTMLRNPAEMDQVLINSPFADAPDEAVKKYVAFLTGIPEMMRTEALTALNNEYESIYFSNKEAYILLRKDNPAKERFTNTFIEKKLGLSATVRNWATVNKLAQLQKEKK